MFRGRRDGRTSVILVGSTKRGARMCDDLQWQIKPCTFLHNSFSGDLVYFLQVIRLKSNRPGETMKVGEQNTERGPRHLSQMAKTPKRVKFHRAAIGPVSHNAI